jgi:uroporphyrin-III C-methyltransferase
VLFCLALILLLVIYQSVQILAATKIIISGGSMKKRYNTTKNYSPTNGKVFLVGAGPGACDLLTIKALRTIQSCDVILYDNLVSREIRALFPAGTKKIFVGKRNKDHSLPQAELNQLMIKLAQKGTTVCRLKGGDPFVFGRGSEEMLELHKEGVDVEIVPGITAASGCSGYAGIPLTHRGLSQGCTFVTGHAEKDLSIDWSSLASLNHTLVFYMGLSQAENISYHLIRNGLSPDTPSALIENGSQAKQRVIETTIEHLNRDALSNRLKSPTLIIVGEVVSLREQLQWFNQSIENQQQRLTA